MTLISPYGMLALVVHDGNFMPLDGSILGYVVFSVGGV